MPVDVSSKSILVYDYGAFSSVAERLGREFGKTYLYVPWQDEQPRMAKALIGDGVPNVERVKSFWETVDRVDAIYFPDTCCGDLVEFLRARGYPVLGAGKSEILELDRWRTRRIQKAVGLPVQRTVRVTGLDNLVRYLKDHDDLVVKMNIFRGEIETFKHSDFAASEPLLDHLDFTLGKKGDRVEFMVEETKHGVEPGVDALVYDGKFLDQCTYGYELKDKAYICRASFYADVPEKIKTVSDKLLPVMGKLGTRSFFSTELIVDESDSRPYLIDLTLRNAGPTMLPAQGELWPNLGAVIYGMATGELVEPEPVARYAGGVCLNSDWNEINWLKVDYPTEISEHVSTVKGAVFDGVRYNVPCYSDCAVVTAIGDTVEEVSSLLKERIGQVKAYQLDTSTGCVDDVVELAEEGKKAGIEF